MFILITVGVASSPTLLMRSGVTETTFEARKSFAWGTVFLGFVVLSVPAYVIFFRYLIFDPQLKIVADSLPAWVETLMGMGLFEAGDSDGSGALTANELKLGRDGIFIGLPQLAGLSKTLESLVFATLLCAALAGLCAKVMMMAQSLVRDLYFKKMRIEADVMGGRTILLTRLVVVLIVAGLAGLVLHFDFDGFQLFVAGLVFCALSLFPCLLLSVWWQGFNQEGAVTSLVVGFGLAVGVLVLTNFGGRTFTGMTEFFGLGLFEAGCLALILVFASGFLAALLGQARGQEDLEPLNEIRTPGGEAVYDRHLRLVMPRRSSGQS